MIKNSIIREIIIISFISITFFYLTSCRYFNSFNPVGKNLEDCSTNEKIKISLLKIFPNDTHNEKYNSINSYVWTIRETNWSYEVYFDFKPEIYIKGNMIGTGDWVKISKKDCQIVEHLRW